MSSERSVQSSVEVSACCRRRRSDGRAAGLVGVRRVVAGVRAQVGPVAAVAAAGRRAGTGRARARGAAARVRRARRRDRQVQVHRERDRATPSTHLLTILLK